MTEELFRDDATLRECSATVLALSEGGVILDRTVFYPLGGGQAGDTGVLRLADGREFAVTDTRKLKEGHEHAGNVLHVLAPDSTIAVGEGVNAQIDVARRNASDRLEDLVDDDRRQSQRWLVHEQDSWAGHQGPADGEHLLLPAAQTAG